MEATTTLVGPTELTGFPGFIPQSSTVDGKRLRSVSQQKVSQWQRGRQAAYIEYKFRA